MPQVNATCTPETEAKLNWCPQTPRAYASDGSLAPHCLCIASACGVWVAEEGEDPPAGWCGLINPEPAAPSDGGGGGGSTVLAPCTYAELPAPGSVAAGTLGMCTDAPSNIFGGMLTAGGGAFCVPVYVDGNDGMWRQG